MITLDISDLGSLGMGHSDRKKPIADKTFYREVSESSRALVYQVECASSQSREEISQQNTDGAKVNRHSRSCFLNCK